MFLYHEGYNGISLSEITEQLLMAFGNYHTGLSSWVTCIPKTLNCSPSSMNHPNQQLRSS